MPRFFITQPLQEEILLSGENGRHISRSLRMQVGDTLTLCDGCGTDFSCVITKIEGDLVTVSIKNSAPSIGEPSVFVTVYQALPKSDKMDSIIQKSVECGVSEIVPVLTARCISRPDAKAAEKKQQRWQKIAEEAAKQCGRGIIPTVREISTYQQALLQASKAGPILFFYEGGGMKLQDAIPMQTTQISVFIGPEGGFSPEEVFSAEASGAKTTTLGPRILRTETAPIAALTSIMLLTGNLDREANFYA